MIVLRDSINEFLKATSYRFQYDPYCEKCEYYDLTYGDNLDANCGAGEIIGVKITITENKAPDNFYRIYQCFHFWIHKSGQIEYANQRVKITSRDLREPYKRKIIIDRESLIDLDDYEDNVSLAEEDSELEDGEIEEPVRTCGPASQPGQWIYFYPLESWAFEIFSDL